tara:strand:+ start:3984 stop:5714 length:1731 start_codon:yes stop_codon:yes gene_type:complete
MPVSGIDFTVNHNFINNNNLLLYYDFTSGTGTPLDQTNPASTTNYTVTVQNVGGGNKYFIDSVQQPTLELTEGNTYVFDWSDSSAQGHPVRFSTTSDGTHGGGSEYTVGVTKDDSSYKTTIVVAASAPTLYYYCQYHAGMGGQANTPTSSSRAVIKNQIPAFNTGLYSGIVAASFNETASLTDLQYATGKFLASGKADLTESNLIVNTPSLKYNSLSVLVDFEFRGQGTHVNQGIIFGGLEKTSSNINGDVITGAKGFNFGINDRGKLYYRGFDNKGDFIHTASSIELSKRNIISFSLDNDILQISRFDYLNQKIQKNSFDINTEFISNSDQFYLGGSKTIPTYTGDEVLSGEKETFSGYINEFALLSGYIPSNILMNVGSGMIGDYFHSVGSSTTKEQVTGYSESIIYKTGITGYDFNVTGTLSISTGRDMQTGSFTSDSTSSIKEGDKYFKYYTLNNDGVKTFYKEEIGFLNESSGFSYVPTGTEAFATLGLNDIGGSIATQIETEGIDKSGVVTVNLYESVPQTGTLNEISGITQTPLSETITIPAIAVSGITLEGDSEDFKKDYIYFLEERL